MPNVFEPEFEPEVNPRDWPAGYEGRGAQVGKGAGGEHLGASLYEIPPGNSICPYHWHAANEELLIVLSGTPTLRTPEGERGLAKGEVVAFPVGERGAHKVTNDGSEPARVLMVSEMNQPEVTVYPDSNKVGVRQRSPGAEATGLRLNFREGDAVDYWEGEIGAGEDG